MCGDVAGTVQQATGEDEYFLDAPYFIRFVARARSLIASSAGPEEAIGALRPAFAELLHDDDWLPAAFQADAPASGMGGGIGQWLLFRAGDGSLSLFSLVVPSTASTPVHDHLAWGLIGLYRGEQEETVYTRRDPLAPVGTHEPLVPKLRRVVRRGDFYPLLPPTDDIHQVRTTSPETSVSIHLLANDTGCIWRHTYEPEAGTVKPFRSGYVNRPCPERSDFGP